jgi:preprotein translocase subunit SecD
MRRTVLAGLSICVLLAACGGVVQARYRLSFNTTDTGQLTELSIAVTRIVERRLQGMGEEVRSLDVTQKSEGPELSFKVESQAAADLLREDLTEPFALSIMRAAESGETPKLEIDAHGGFVDTGITEKHLEWVLATEEPDNRGRITLRFTKEGRELMRKVFKQNVGKQIGLFVREKLIAKLQVDTAELKDDIIITGIPSADLARVFADDVNVGLHVTFTPLP